MALRDYECACGKRFDMIFKGDYPKTTRCPQCGGQAKYVITGGATFRMEFRPGYDMGAGRSFDTKKERSDWLAENNLKAIKD